MDENEKRENKRYFHIDGFIKGILAGAAATILGTAIAGAWLHNEYGMVLAQEPSGSKSLTVADDGSLAVSAHAQAGESEEIIDTELLEKLQTLEACIEQYFLFDTAGADSFKDSIYKGYMEALDDPYSCYYTAEEYSQMMESTSGSYQGIGVTVSQNAETKIITVVQPFEGAPGAKAGILPGDIITEVAGQDVSDMDLSAVVSYIKGEVGTTVSIRVYRESDGEYHDFEVERAQIEVPTVSYEMLEGQIGYVEVIEFDEVTSDQYIAAVEELKAQGMKALVVDIRNNPGGLLNVVVEMLDYMLPEGTIVYTEDKNGEGDKYSSDAEHYFELPLAVLVNGNSASASEVFSGAIKDYGIGKIVGTQTYGKGIVQHVLPFSDGSAIKLTVSRYFTPSGICIHGVGITPDIEVELDEELQTRVTVSHEEDNQLQAAIQALQEQPGK